VSAVDVVLLWHMHQPPYRDPLRGQVLLPWTRLHALKDYLGMVELLAQTPDVHVTFNLVPALVDQLDDYAHGRVDEPLWQLGLRPAEELDERQRLVALELLFRAHERHVLGRFPRYAELRERRGAATTEQALRQAVLRFSNQDLRDLQVLSRLAWMDLGWQARDPALRALVAKGRGYDLDDQALLAERERALLAAVLPAYRAAAAQGRIELCTSPYYHPILPLLCDSAAHHEAHPGAPLPRRYSHPEDAYDQLARARQRHTDVFGDPPRGVWPPEGSLSEAAVTELARAGARWTASDEAVLARSLAVSFERDAAGLLRQPELLYRPWRRSTPAGDLHVLFRDRVLSDLIGFSYAQLEPVAAAHDLLARLRAVGESWRRAGLSGRPVVGVMLDGENAWEHFADGGRTFLATLYAGLQDDPGLRARTVSEAIAAAEAWDLPRVFAGSWIQADFSVWIGHAEDRRAWDLLGEARDALERSRGYVPAAAWERAHEALRAACASDWFWWYGDEHSTPDDLEFDLLFRRHVEAVYQFLGLLPPPALGSPLIGSRRTPRAPEAPRAALDPVLDGRVTDAQEWAAAGHYEIPLCGTSMHRGVLHLRRLRYGFGGGCLHVLVEATQAMAALLADHEAGLHFQGTRELRYRLRQGPTGLQVRREERSPGGWLALPTRARGASAEVCELSLPLDELACTSPQTRLLLRLQLSQGGTPLEQHPEFDALALAGGLE
jgi:alpha-amylase/alpha-mannosidase (GH57 family)